MPYQRLATYLQIIQVSGKWRCVYVDLKPSVEAFGGEGLDAASGSPWASSAASLWETLPASDSLDSLKNSSHSVSHSCIFSTRFLHVSFQVPNDSPLCLSPVFKIQFASFAHCTSIVIFFLPHCCLLAYSYYAHYTLGENDSGAHGNAVPVMVMLPLLGISS